MEQVQTNLHSMLIEQKRPWYKRLSVTMCRKLVFNQLDQVTDACIEIHQDKTVKVLGEATSDLKAIVVINNEETFLDFVTNGSIGAAEAYIKGLWTSPDLTKVIQFFARAQHTLDSIEDQTAWITQLKNKLFHFRNNNTLQGSKSNILAHYDLGNDLYERFLDQQMQYSSAIFTDDGQSLDDAQIHKLDTICQRLELTDQDHLLEIGSGWGGLAIHAAVHYGCQVTTTTISDAQHQYVAAKIEKLGLEHQITLLKQDYRLLTGEFDKLVSIEMIEAVGHKNFPTFFKQCHDLLKPKGKLLLQAITIADQRFDYYCNNVDFIQRYIFPGGCLPSIASISANLATHTGLVIEQLQDIGLDYAQTLAHWRQRFESSWSELETLGYDEYFKRLWQYYLCYCEGAFMERATSAIHLIARK